MPSNEKIILIVDDENEILNFVKSFLESRGYKAFATSNGREAIDIIKTKNTSLVLLDLNMPVMSGIDILKELKNSNISATIYLVTSSDEDQIEEARSLGVKGVLKKPVNMMDLIAIID
jgi:DNA-binding response OmpR family regulator